MIPGIEIANAVVPGQAVVRAADERAELAAWIGAVGHLEQAGRGDDVTGRELDGPAREFQQLRRAPRDDPGDGPGPAVVGRERHHVVARQGAIGRLDRDGLLRIVAMKAIAQRQQRSVAQQDRLEEVAGGAGVPGLVVQRTLQLPCSTKVAGPCDVGRQVHRFERLADHEEGEELARGQLDHAREIAVPAAQHRFRVLIDDVALDKLDHGHHHLDRYDPLRCRP